ncbi:hypothetical protein GIB67_035612 [Kingdonia uniflora]|uniref:Uncharacterized protein n=1 Tax=Kingdonia uniflora TaxID=39325 RepID=A0A7J7LKY2_9MAGN|nr:hypothetical protein GIB67_035612 [Kingdonia uniflora]
MAEIKARVVNNLLSIKTKSGKTFSQIAKETGLTNVYVAQLLRRQAQLKPETAPKLRESLPGIPDDLLEEMMKPPMRSFNPNIIQDPTIYRRNQFTELGTKFDILFAELQKICNSLKNNNTMVGDKDKDTTETNGAPLLRNLRQVDRGVDVDPQAIYSY